MAKHLRTVQRAPQKREWLAAKDLAELLERTTHWLYYHSRAADGPIQRRWGKAKDKRGQEYNLVEFNVADAVAWAKDYVKGGRRGSLYPASVVQERIGTPAELAAIQQQQIAAFVRQCVHDTLAERKVKSSRRRLKVIAGGRAS